MRRPSGCFIITPAVAACSALAACDGGGSDSASRGEPDALGSDTIASRGTTTTDANG